MEEGGGRKRKQCLSACVEKKMDIGSTERPSKLQAAAALNFLSPPFVFSSLRLSHHPPLSSEIIMTVTFPLHSRLIPAPGCDPGADLKKPKQITITLVLN